MKRLRVLCVDDERDIGEVACLALELEDGIEARACESGRQALELAPQWLPDLVILDYVMPEMDGPETLRRIRQDSRLAKIPVVFMTARTQPHDVATLKAAGAAGIIPKPFDPGQLARLVKSFVAP